MVGKSGYTPTNDETATLTTLFGFPRDRWHATAYPESSIGGVFMGKFLRSRDIARSIDTGIGILELFLEEPDALSQVIGSAHGLLSTGNGVSVVYCLSREGTILG